MSDAPDPEVLTPAPGASTLTLAEVLGTMVDDLEVLALARRFDAVVQDPTIPVRHLTLVASVILGIAITGAPPVVPLDLIKVLAAFNQGKSGEVGPLAVTMVRRLAARLEIRPRVHIVPPNGAGPA